jgi:ribosomal protein L32E
MRRGREKKKRKEDWKLKADKMSEEWRRKKGKEGKNRIRR